MSLEGSSLCTYLLSGCRVSSTGRRAVNKTDSPTRPEGDRQPKAGSKALGLLVKEPGAVMQAGKRWPLRTAMVAIRGLVFQAEGSLCSGVEGGPCGWSPGRGVMGASPVGAGVEMVSVLGCGSLWALSWAPDGTGQCWAWGWGRNSGTTGFMLMVEPGLGGRCVRGSQGGLKFS